MFYYATRFHGRLKDAIGVTYAIRKTIESSAEMDREAVIDHLYQEFEHITAVKIEGLAVTRDRPVFGRQYRLTGNNDQPSIARGDSWADSEDKV